MSNNQFKKQKPNKTKTSQFQTKYATKQCKEADCRADKSARNDEGRGLMSR